MTAADRAAAVEAYETMAQTGLRTLALARRETTKDVEFDEDSIERDLTLLGIVGIIDPPRPEVPEAVRTAQAAGIKVLMITGDAVATGKAIGKRIGLRAERALTGTELEALDDSALLEAVDAECVVARATPEHKMRIVSLLQRRGEIVAMTGDGVNDAPALRKADVGIAMGHRGTDVAKGASDMLLLDDNFASIIGAVEEGRRQYHNIQKFVRYMLSSHLGEVIAIFVSIMLNAPLILLPVQILWMNMVTDGVTALALGLEPAERGIMRRPPRVPNAPMLDRPGLWMIGLLGGYIGIATLAMYHLYYDGDPSRTAIAQTMAFTGIIVLEKFNVFNYRMLDAPLARQDWFANHWLLVAVASMIGLQALAVYVPFLQHALHTVPLGWDDWGIIFAFAAPILVVTEGYKRWRFRD